MKYLLLFATFLLIGCRLEGTGTGNPMKPQPANQDQPVYISATVWLTARICNKLAGCYGSAFAPEECVQASMELDSYAIPLGVNWDPALPLPTNRELQEMEMKMELIHDPDAVDACAGDIAQLRCDSEQVGRGYDPTQAQPFAQTAALLAPSCAGVFAHAQ